MNKTAEHLWWDKDFIEKRIKEQEDYMLEKRTAHYTSSNVDSEYECQRYHFLQENSGYVLKRLERQLERIKQLK